MVVSAVEPQCRLDSLHREPFINVVLYNVDVGNELFYFNYWMLQFCSKEFICQNLTVYYLSLSYTQLR